MEQLKQQLQAAGILYKENEPLSAHCTFRIGGPADLFVMPRDEDQLCQTVQFCKQAEIRYYLLGNGSNILFADEGFSGVVIDVSALDAEIAVEDTVLTAGAGVRLAALCKAALKHGLSGLEFAYGIPGTVGGAVYMNAGAYGGEMKDIVQSVRAVDYLGNPHEFSAEELDFGYRHSKFCGGGYIITEATLRLAHGDMDEISAKMAELTAKRKEKQPLEYRSAGSTFKRPQGTFAALLIEQCGLKGYSCGAAQVSEKHSGFVINKGGASFDDVMSVISHVKETVYAKTGIMLECEPEIIE